MCYLNYYLSQFSTSKFEFLFGIPSKPGSTVLFKFPELAPNSVLICSSEDEDPSKVNELSSCYKLQFFAPSGFRIKFECVARTLCYKTSRNYNTYGYSRQTKVYCTLL